MLKIKLFAFEDWNGWWLLFHLPSFWEKKVHSLIVGEKKISNAHWLFFLFVHTVKMSGGKVTIQDDYTFLSNWKLALEMSCHLTGSSRAIISSYGRADAVPKTKELIDHRGKLTTNMLPSWLHSDLPSSLVVSAPVLQGLAKRGCVNTDGFC